MVKNIVGGCKSKKMARKTCQTASIPSTMLTIRYSSNENEEYAMVKKMFGNGRCLVLTNKDKELHCIIRNKFRGRSKRGNVVSIGSFILVGLREWESKTGYKTCDLLEVYEEDEVMLLKNNKDFQTLIKETEEKEDIFSCSFATLNEEEEVSMTVYGGEMEEMNTMDEFIDAI